MASISVKHFSAVDYIKNLRKADFTEAQAEAVVEIVEQQALMIQEQQNKITQLETKELATKGDTKDLELKIEQSKNQTLLWMFGMLSGFAAFFLAILAKGFHWW